MLPNINCEYNEVYYVESTTGVINPIAIRPHINNHLVWWEDTSRGTSVQIAQFTLVPSDQGPDAPPIKIILIEEEGEEIILSKLTLKVYNEKIRDRVIGTTQFMTDKEVSEFYLQSDFENY